MNGMELNANSCKQVGSVHVKPRPVLSLVLVPSATRSHPVSAVSPWRYALIIEATVIGMGTPAIETVSLLPVSFESQHANSFDHRDRMPLFTITFEIL